MDNFSEIIEQLHIAQTIVIFVGMWFFYNRLDKKVDKQIDKLDSKIEKLDTKVEKLSDKVEDIDRRLCRIEGSLATQWHFHSNPIDKKIEQL